MTHRAAIIGGGVIGGGWAARFLLNGWDVQVFDPDPEAERKIGQVLANARRSLPGLTDVALPPEGRLQFCETLQEAVEHADWIQESVPERLDIKHETLADIQKMCRADAVIGSSTSGFKPSQLQEGAARPGQIMVCHPFNPVYLLPLVEVVTTPANTAESVEGVKTLLQEVGMYPLHLKKEIDAHVADRFLEAVWREALWLVKDGIATTAEIDDAIRYGFGIRWAQMGLFETYRVAGGEAGMKHFMAQFGPALKWPWTKLMDVPEFNDDLVDLIAGQSDAQSGAYTIQELEQIRDGNLVAMMRALKTQNWGVGALLAQHEDRLRNADAVSSPLDHTAPVVTGNRVVPLDWTDYNGHMNEARYLQAFADATDRFMAIIGCDADYIAAGHSYFTAETHIRHLDEVNAGQIIRIETTALGGGGKKLHLWHEMYVGGKLIATGEHFLLHVDLKTRKAAPASSAVDKALKKWIDAHGKRPLPEGVGRAIRSSAPR
ncbi:carnitine 3-dehydrogenase [Roseobacter denitrificans]|uniref:L-carnitine dehydrogenase n=1 Tax=Roseobacter denitrificans (strain ATCC 33942 / OCh 114) TaxID=375451 RepID=Q166L2_ROSDO|nr:carnitine 3-dehydrogenase [Roseobacter denitrificans]ABG32081.1 3-hydroxyacyl-CoA dehydrogenase, putative [Roseobacter denitrificans OCh 114]AVL51600.1 carnitine 3-dehydrogenase [Roseobacter denitrificans]SFF77080.1 carnitine 3-dehydrogenase [Roseobacter denitrificans OCh 114]